MTSAARTADEAALDCLARNIETLRSAAGWSLATVAKRSGVALSRVKQVVHRRANPSIAEVVRLADAFGVPVAGLTDHVLDDGSLPGPGDAAPRHDAAYISAALGRSVRMSRRAKGLATRPFAALAHVARNTLHDLESGETQPRMRLVARIAHALGLPFGAFVDSVRSPVLAFSANRSTHGRGTRARELLHDTGAADSWRMEELSLRRGEAVQHPGVGAGATMMAYVIEGRARIAFRSETIALKKGEAALLAADRPFAIDVDGTRLLRLLLVLRSAGEATD